MYGIYDDIFWWQSKKEPHLAIDKYITVLRDNQNDFYNDLSVYVGLYGGRPLHNSEDTFRYRSNRPRLTFNIVHSLCLSAQAKIAKHRPGISFLTYGGDWAQQNKAKSLKKFMQGQIYSTNAYKIAQRAFLDACIVGTGIIKVLMEHGKTKLERVPLTEMTIDGGESSTSDPRQMFQTKMVSRHVLAAKFPKHKEQILEAVQEVDSNEGEESRYSDLIKCHESWHLPSGPESGDGRHIISIATATLLDEEYERDHFPFIFIRWTESPESFWGNGLAKEVKGIQVEVNKLLAQIQQQMHLATPKVFIEDTSKIVNAQMNNRVWGMVQYRGKPPQFFLPRAVSGEMFSHLDRLVEKAYEMTGISQLSAQSRKPTGIESAVALREVSDIESERFMVVGQEYEEAFVSISKQLIQLVKEAVDSGEEYSSVSFSEKEGVEKINWGEVNMEDDEYIMRVQPVGSLPQTPAAKLASVTEMHMNGMLTTEEAHQILPFPDLERADRLKNAPRELIDKLIYGIIDKNQFEPPEPYLNLEWGVERFQQAYSLAKIDGVPEERLELLRRWIAKAVALLEPAAPPPQPGPEMGMGAGMPPGPMGPPEVMPPGAPMPPMPMPMGAPPAMPPGAMGPPAIG